VFLPLNLPFLGKSWKLKNCVAEIAGHAKLYEGFLKSRRVLRDELRTVVLPVATKSGIVPFLKALVLCAIAPVVLS